MTTDIGTSCRDEHDPVEPQYVKEELMNRIPPTSVTSTIRTISQPGNYASSKADTHLMILVAHDSSEINDDL